MKKFFNTLFIATATCILGLQLANCAPNKVADQNTNLNSTENTWVNERASQQSARSTIPQDEGINLFVLSNLKTGELINSTSPNEGSDYSRKIPDFYNYTDGDDSIFKVLPSNTKIAQSKLVRIARCSKNNGTEHTAAYQTDATKSITCPTHFTLDGWAYIYKNDPAPGAAVAIYLYGKDTNTVISTLNFPEKNGKLIGYAFDLHSGKYGQLISSFANSSTDIEVRPTNKEDNPAIGEIYSCELSGTNCINLRLERIGLDFNFEGEDETVSLGNGGNRCLYFEVKEVNNNPTPSPFHLNVYNAAGGIDQLTDPKSLSCPNSALIQDKITIAFQKKKPG